ncbi:MAG: hypothetical protein R3A11_08420 [Bdellovibrionota bacterium]
MKRFLVTKALVLVCMILAWGGLDAQEHQKTPYVVIEPDIITLPSSAKDRGFLANDTFEFRVYFFDLDHLANLFSPLTFWLKPIPSSAEGKTTYVGPSFLVRKKMEIPWAMVAHDLQNIEAEDLVVLIYEVGWMAHSICMVSAESTKLAVEALENMVKNKKVMSYHYMHANQCSFPDAKNRSSFVFKAHVVWK